MFAAIPPTNAPADSPAKEKHVTLSGYLVAFRRRWTVILACVLAAALAMWVATPPGDDARSPVASYTATATLIVTGRVQPSAGGSTAAGQVPVGVVALYVRNGAIPERAAQQLGYQGNPVELATTVVVADDPETQSLRISATSADRQVAADRANVFADETVKFFSEERGVGISVLQKAVALADNKGFVVPPNRGVRMALAAGLGLLLGLALALVLEHLDGRLRTRKEVASVLQVPIIAEVPRLRRLVKGKDAVLLRSDPLGVAADAYRTVRASLVHGASHIIPRAGGPTRSAGAAGLLDSGRETPAILVTSAFAGEGKSTSTANIAAAFAESGHRVLVLDADLRSPDMTDFLDVPGAAGISDLLEKPGEYRLESLVRPTSVPGVSLLTAGLHLDHPEAMASRLKGVIDEAKQLADVVLIDSAPVLVTSDTYDILPVADALLLVVRSGRLTTAIGQKLVELLGRFQVPVAGVIIIAPPRSDAEGYGYGYGYGYRYRYGYGYGSKKKRSGARYNAKQTPREGAEISPPPAQEPAEDAAVAARLPGDAPDDPPGAGTTRTV